MPEEWLSLGGVARLLGVHPSTARLWADRGVLPVHRTQGRHRRFLRREIELWLQTRRSTGASEADLVIQNALRNTRFSISEGRLNAEAWYSKLDEDARTQYRVSGRDLLQGLIGFLTSDGKQAIAQAEALGYEYAARARRYGLSSLEATQAFLFFRNMLSESMLSVYESAAVHSPHAWSDMFRKINEFTDHILVVILETYEVLQKGSR